MCLDQQDADETLMHAQPTSARPHTYSPSICRRLLQSVLAYTSQLPPQQRSSKLQRLLQPLLTLNTSSSSTQAAADGQAVADLLAATFDTLHGSSSDAAEQLLVAGGDTSSSTPTAP